MNIDIDTILTVFFAVVPAFSVVIAVIKKFYPESDPYFRKSAVVLNEVDDIIDKIVAEYPNNEAINTTNDILDKLLAELEQAGYDVDKQTKKKLENRTVSKLKNEEGMSLKSKTGDFEIKLNGKF